MVQQAQKTITFVIVLAVSCLVPAGNCFAEDLTVTLIINPKETDIYLGSSPIALTAKAKGKNLTFKWELVGPGKLDGKSSAMFYTLPETIAVASAQVVITVIVIDDTGQEVRESVTFTILPRIPTPIPAPKPTPTPATTLIAKTGMGMGTKVVLGVGAIAALGGGIALADGGGGDSWCAGAVVGGYCWYLGAGGESCTQVCAPHGGYHEATHTYAGSEGTDSNCVSVLSALTTTPGYRCNQTICHHDPTTLGCYIDWDPTYFSTTDIEQPHWYRGINEPTTAAAYSVSWITRACACKE